VFMLVYRMQSLCRHAYPGLQIPVRVNKGGTLHVQLHGQEILPISHVCDITLN
jgi:hypothetical protein